MMPSLLVCAIAAPLGFLFWLCGGVTFFAAFAAMVLTTLVVLSAGWASLRALGVPNSSPSAAWVLGVFAISLVLYVLVQWLELRALIAAALLAAVAGGLAWRGGFLGGPVDPRGARRLLAWGAGPPRLWPPPARAPPPPPPPCRGAGLGR